MANPSLTPDYRTVGMLLKQADDEFLKEANNILRPLELTYSQANILLLIDRAPGTELTLRELEHLSHTSQQACTGTVARLEKKNYLEYVRDREDRRVKHIRLTKRGRELIDPITACLRQAERRVFEPLSEKEQQEFLYLLKKVRSGMK